MCVHVCMWGGMRTRMCMRACTSAGKRGRVKEYCAFSESVLHPWLGAVCLHAPTHTPAACLLVPLVLLFMPANGSLRNQVREPPTFCHAPVPQSQVTTLLWRQSIPELGDCNCYCVEFGWVRVCTFMLCCRDCSPTHLKAGVQGQQLGQEKWQVARVVKGATSAHHDGVQSVMAARTELKPTILTASNCPPILHVGLEFLTGDETAVL